MKRTLLLTLLAASLCVAARADISLPRKDNFYDKLGRGLANIVVAPAEILDSHYTLLQTEGETVAFFKGFLVQGPSRMLQDMALGVVDVATAPFPITNIPPQEEYEELVVERRFVRTRREPVYMTKSCGTGGNRKRLDNHTVAETNVTVEGTFDPKAMVETRKCGYAPSVYYGYSEERVVIKKRYGPCRWGTYGTMKSAPYDSMVVRDYPPGDLENWY
ncbi:MAG: hypothetical protein ACAI35_14785 [Candidatus Methylacidiphilales bacterium]|nr:hypothetical protein [Candidatus Methylacidiphilales bacterium]